MITLDTSGFGALLNARDVRHRQVVEAFDRDGGPYLIPAMIMTELAWYLESRVDTRMLSLLLSDIESHAYTLVCGDDDIPRIRELVERYADMPLGFADAAVVACAERHGGKVLTLDHRHFGVVAREVNISIIP